MSILENAELVESRKIDQYTYFRRNEEVIREFGEWYNKEVSIQSDEIDKLLGVVDRNESKCRDMYDFTVLKLEDIQRKIEGLKRIEQMLVDLKERCPENKDIYECPIIETLMKK